MFKRERFLKEARKQGLAAPLVGEVTLTGQNVIDLAGGAAEWAIAHVGLATSAPVPSIENFVAKFRKRYGRDTDHNGIKGYIGVYAIKYATELVGKFDRKVHEVFLTLQKLRDNGVTVLMVEQNAKAALAISDYGLVLELGQTRMYDRANTLLADARVGRVFLGGSIEEAAV